MVWIQLKRTNICQIGSNWIIFPKDHPWTFQNISKTSSLKVQPYTVHAYSDESSLDMDSLNHPSRSYCHYMASSGILAKIRQPLRIHSQHPNGPNHLIFAPSGGQYHQGHIFALLQHTAEPFQTLLGLWSITDAISDRSLGLEPVNVYLAENVSEIQKAFMSWGLFQLSNLHRLGEWSQKGTTNNGTLCTTSILL